jgi:hypothetical protein
MQEFQKGDWVTIEMENPLGKDKELQHQNGRIIDSKAYPKDKVIRYGVELESGRCFEIPHRHLKSCKLNNNLTDWLEG